MRSLALAFVLVVPGTLSAQAAPATFMDWGRVSSSLYSDPVMGVQLWIGTSLRTTGVSITSGQRAGPPRVKGARAGGAEAAARAPRSTAPAIDMDWLTISLRPWPR